MRLSVLPPEGTFFTLGENRGGSAVAPDGRKMAFIATEAGTALLWVRPLDSLEAQPLPGTEGASCPFWAPDSRAIGFFAEEKLKTIDLAGGPPRTVCDAPAGRGGSWNRSGTIVFTPRTLSPIYRVSAEGGEPTPITVLDPSRRENSHYWPQFLPDGCRFIYWARAGEPRYTGIYVGDAEAEPVDQRPVRLAQSFSNALYAPGEPGHLLFARGQTLLAQRFDPNHFRLEGDPLAVAEQVGSVADAGLWHFSVSANGVLAYGGGGDVVTKLTWWSREGKPLGVLGEAGDYYAPAFAPDDSRLAVALFDAQTGGGDIWTIEVERRAATRFTFQPELQLAPVWSPGGERIAFACSEDGPLNLCVKAVSGMDEEQRLTKSQNTQVPEDWSRDGRFLLYQESSSETGRDLWIFPMTPEQGSAEREPASFLRTPFDESQGQFSADGRWIAYCSDESGRDEIYVRSFQGAERASGGKWRVSTGGGSQPRWRGDGKELFYLTADGTVMAAAVSDIASGFETGTPRALFGPVSVSSPERDFAYDVTDDGQRFIMVTSEDESSVPSMTVAVNWPALLPP